MTIYKFWIGQAEEQEQVNPMLQKREEEIAKLYNQMCEVASLTCIYPHFAC